MPLSEDFNHGIAIWLPTFIKSTLSINILVELSHSGTHLGTALAPLGILGLWLDAGVSAPKLGRAASLDILLVARQIHISVWLLRIRLVACLLVFLLSWSLVATVHFCLFRHCEQIAPDVRVVFVKCACHQFE